MLNKKQTSAPLRLCSNHATTRSNDLLLSAVDNINLPHTFSTSIGIKFVACNKQYKSIFHINIWLKSNVIAKIHQMFKLDII